MKSKLLTLAAGLALVAIAGKFFAVPLMAQVRAALVQNVDEHGRIPYQSTSESNNCTGGALCDVFFPAVPNNKRLVITHFDTVVFVDNGTLAFMYVTTPTSNNRAYPEFTAGPVVGGNSIFLSSRAVEFYVDGGIAPTVHYSATQGGGTFPLSTTLTGYLLDCTSGCAAIAQ